MRIRPSVEGLAIRGLRKKHRPDCGGHPPGGDFWGPHQDGFWEDLGRNPEPKPARQSSEELCSDGSAGVEVRCPTLGIAIRLVNGCKRNPFGPTVEENRSFELKRFRFAEMGVEPHFCSSNTSQPGRSARRSPNASIILKKWRNSSNPLAIESGSVGLNAVAKAGLCCSPPFIQSSSSL